MLVLVDVLAPAVVQVRHQLPQSILRLLPSQVALVAVVERDLEITPLSPGMARVKTMARHLLAKLAQLLARVRVPISTPTAAAAVAVAVDTTAARVDLRQ
jgi:hypothetical protein